MATILALETSTEICSVSIGRNQEILGKAQSSTSYSHASEITLLIQDALNAAAITWANLDAIAVSAGPGSFTGLRVGAAAAKAICFCHQIPLVAIDTLEALATSGYKLSEMSGSAYLLPMIDARRDEVYLAVYRQNLECLVAPTDFTLDENRLLELLPGDQPILVMGSGSQKFQADSPRFRHVLVESQADHLLDLAGTSYQMKRFADVATFKPRYIKSPHITTPKKVL